MPHRYRIWIFQMRPFLDRHHPYFLLANIRKYCVSNLIKIIPQIKNLNFSRMEGREQTATTPPPSHFTYLLLLFKLFEIYTLWRIKPNKLSSIGTNVDRNIQLYINLVNDTKFQQGQQNLTFFQIFDQNIIIRE